MKRFIFSVLFLALVLPFTASAQNKKALRIFAQNMVCEMNSISRVKRFCREYTMLYS